MSEYRQLVNKRGLESLAILRGPSQAQDHHLGLSLLIDVNVYVEPIRRGCSVFCKNVNYSNMSTKVLSKTYIRSYIHAHYQEGLVELLQQASFDSWLDYPTILQLEMVLRTRVHYSPLQYTTEDPPPSSYGRAILGTHTYLEAFSSFHLLVYELYRQPSSPLPRTRLFE